MKQSNSTFNIPRFSFPSQKYTYNSTEKKRERLHQVHKNLVLAKSDKIYTDMSGKTSVKTSVKICELIEYKIRAIAISDSYWKIRRTNKK